MTAALLAPWRGAAEVAFANTTEVLPLDAPIAALWDPARCPEEFLPFLAWTLDAVDFDPSASVETRRRVVAEAIRIHRERGTRSGVLRALAAAGFGTATLYERWGENTLDGSRDLDGTWTLALADHWAEFRVILNRPVSLAQAARARATILRAAPARCHLKSLDFREAAMILDGSWLLDATYSLGEA